MSDRKQIERDHAEQMAAKLSPEEYALWRTTPVASRISVHQDSILIMWSLEGDQPKLIDVFTVVEVRASWRLGMSLRLDSKSYSEVPLWITHEPTPLFGKPVFVWMPFMPDVRYERHPRADGWVMRTSLSVRTQSHPDTLTDGDIYLTSIGEFRGRYPQFASTRF